jgi:hypothetical protein
MYLFFSLRLLQWRKVMRYITLNSRRIGQNIRALIIISVVKTFPGTEQETSLLSRSLQCASCNCNWFQTTGICDRVYGILCAVAEQVDWLHSYWNYDIKEPQLTHSSQPFVPAARPHCCNRHLYSDQHDELDPEQRVPPTSPPIL